VADRIQLLPDNIANQIAAGEVIQRPGSAVKELLENAVDAGATEIKLIVTDAGKALLQVIDNGGGMSETDARMCFERHATSKIKNINDLFHIRTMGFRGEALASIAAVAQVELRTKRAEDETGTCIDIENSAVLNQTPVATANGTSIAMKNLFFNVPARRNFLKSNAAEMRNIVDEFMRVALAFPAIFFSLTSNGQQLFHLEAGSLKQRISQLLGSAYASKVVPVKEETDYLNIHGFIGKPETAKKTRGDQYFFVNNRFIKSPYLNHAIMSAYQDMIPADSFPMYVLFIDLDPAQVDVNVHPTKQEIKFEDEKIVYAFVQAAIKHALGQFSITPSLEFDLDATIQGLDSIQKPFTEENKSAAQTSSLFQAFTEANQAHKIAPSSNFTSLRDYTSQPKEDAFEERAMNAALPTYTPAPDQGSSFVSLAAQHGLFEAPAPADEVKLTQLFKTYLLVPDAQHFLLVHQQAAHERVLYEKLLQALEHQPMATQQSLFPGTIEVTPGDAVMLQELLPYFQRMGYSIEPFGKTTFVIQGTPADVETGDEKAVIEAILEQYKHFSSELKLSNREKLLRSVAWQQAIKPGKLLTQLEMQTLINDLFACQTPNAAPNGKPTYTTFRREQIDKLF
jgi:DNA mismatch repair protein MutL